MRPLLKNYKLCKYINNFWIPFSTHLVLCPVSYVPTHFSACPQEPLKPIYLVQKHGALISKLPSSSPQPPASHLEMVIKTYASLTSLASPSSPGETGPSTRHSPKARGSFSQLLQRARTNCFKSALLINSRLTSPSFIFSCLCQCFTLFSLRSLMRFLI